MRLRGNGWVALIRSGSTRLGSSAAERALTCAMLALVALGVLLRARGMFGDVFAFWVDEADWAMQLMDWPLTQPSIRPIGFMAVSKALGNLFGPSEIPLRAVPFAAGVGATLMAPFVAKHLFRWWGARLLFVAVIALHAGAIDLSKEFKPYALGFALHCALMLLALRYVASARGRHLAQALAVAVPAVLFTQDIVFAYPGLFLALATRAWTAKQRKHLIAVSVCAAATLAVVAALYFLMWRTVSQAEPPSYWGGKYDVFFVADPNHPEHTQLGWTLGKYFEVTGLPGMRRKAWEEVMSGAWVQTAMQLDRALWFCLHLLGLLVLAVRRRLYEALLLVLPLVLTVAFNWLGLFPFAVFRTDLFLLAYVAPIAALALDRSPSGRFEPWAALLPVTLLVFVPLATFERKWHEDKSFFTVSAMMPDAIRTLLRLERESESPTRFVFIDEWLCVQWKYYTGYHPLYSRLVKEHPLPEVQCSKDTEHFVQFVRSRMGRTKDAAWLLSSDPRAIRQAARGLLREFRPHLVSRERFFAIYRAQRR